MLPTRRPYRFVNLQPSKPRALVPRYVRALLWYILLGRPPRAK